MFRHPLLLRINLGLTMLGCIFQPAQAAQTVIGSAAAEPPASLLSDTLHKKFPHRSFFLELIKREAQANGLPPTLADAVVRIESGYNPAAVGDVGEIGLMQIRPSTAAMLGFKGTNAELAEPDTNIRYGVAYLAKAWRLAGGDICRALMKYRAGHGQEVMTPLSTEYCRRAHVHLAALGVSDETNGAASLLAKPPVRVEEPASRTAKVTTGPKIISVQSSGALLAANRARIAEAWSRISVMGKR